MINERFLVEKVKSKIESQFDRVWTHKKPSASKEFRDNARKILGYIPILQPELDLIIKTKTGELNAIEVKYLHKPKHGYNLPFYYGIGQALALSRFGFDHVGLWLFVDGGVNIEEINKYGAQAWYFVRNEMQLPLEYSYFKINQKHGKTDIVVMQYTSNQTGRDLIEVDNENFVITFKNENKLKHNPTSKLLRSMIDNYLDNQ